MKRLSVAEDGKATYLVAAAKGDQAAMTSALDLNAIFGFSGLNEMAKKAVAFAVGHVSRNATAGKMDDLADALKAVQERHKSLAAGKWSAGREGGEGESRSTILSQALATVMGCEAADAAEFINGEIQKAWEAAGISVEEDGTLDTETLSKEDLSKARKEAAKVRKNIGDDPAVKLEVAKIRAANTAKELEAATKAAADPNAKKSAFTK